jgi:hypothetical protein
MAMASVSWGVSLGACNGVSSPRRRTRIGQAGRDVQVGGADLDRVLEELVEELGVHGSPPPELARSRSKTSSSAASGGGLSRRHPYSTA